MTNLPSRPVRDGEGASLCRRDSWLSPGSHVLSPAPNLHAAREGETPPSLAPSATHRQMRLMRSSAPTRGARALSLPAEWGPSGTQSRLLSAAWGGGFQATSPERTRPPAQLPNPLPLPGSRSAAVTRECGREHQRMQQLRSRQPRPSPEASLGPRGETGTPPTPARTGWCLVTNWKAAS